MKVIIAGYDIIKSEIYYEWESTEHKEHYNAIVLGHNPRAAQKWVTWDCSDGEDFFWGHYFDYEEDAKADYHRRLLSKYTEQV